MARTDGRIGERLDGRTPVLVGAGVATQRADDPRDGLDAVGLMRAALDAAAADAGPGAAGLLDRVDEIVVPEGIWATRDPGRDVLDGRSPDARSTMAAIGVLQQRCFSRAATQLARGDAEVVVVVGGEAKWRALRSQITGIEVSETNGGGAADVLRPHQDVLPPVEIERGLAAPTHQYAVMESALRHTAGRSVVDHDAHLADLIAGFAAVAATNPDAWNRGGPTVAEIAAAPMVAAPYRKPACSQWNVDQAAAFVLTTVERARVAGVPSERWVFPWAGAESNLMVPLVERADVAASPAVAAVGRALAEAAGRPLAEVELVELYSCFPAAVQIQVAELGLTEAVAAGRPVTVTGGMHYGGGPLNSFTFQALARLVPMLRTEPAARAFVSSVSGMLTKFGAGLWSATPPPAGWQDLDVTAAAESATATRALDVDHVGSASVVGHTVGFLGGAAHELVAVLDTASGGRTIARSSDPDLLERGLADDLVGSSAEVAGERLQGVG